MWRRRVARPAHPRPPHRLAGVPRGTHHAGLPLLLEPLRIAAGKLSPLHASGDSIRSPASARTSLEQPYFTRERRRWTRRPRTSTNRTPATIRMIVELSMSLFSFLIEFVNPSKTLRADLALQHPKTTRESSSSSPAPTSDRMPFAPYAGSLARPPYPVPPAASPYSASPAPSPCPPESSTAPPSSVPA